MALGTVARLNIQLLANPAGVTKGFSVAQQAILQFQNTASGMFGKLAALGAGLGAGGVIGFGVKLAAQAEQARIAFTVMIGNGEKAIDLLERLRSFADVTPFTASEVRDAAGALLAANISVEDILPTLRILGDISQGSAERLKLIAKAYTDVGNKGRLQGEEIRQFAANSINIIGELAKMYDKTTAEVLKMGEAGEISFGDVTRALAQMTQTGGRFHNMMAQQSQTLAGRWSTLKDHAERLAISLGEALAPAAKRTVEVFIGLVTWARSFDTATIQNVVRIGAMVAGFSAMVAVTVQVVRAISTIVSALKALAAAETLTQALSGPKGWAALAAGLAVAAGTAVVVDKAFADIGEEITRAGDSANAAGQEVTDLLKRMDEKSPFGANIALKEAEANAAKLAKEFEKLQNRADSLRLDLRTPIEIFADSVKELRELYGRDFIDAETFERGVARAQEMFSKSLKDTKVFKVELQQGVGAALKGSAEAIRASAASDRQLKYQEEIAKHEKEQSELQRRMVESLLNIDRKLDFDVELVRARL